MTDEIDRPNAAREPQVATRRTILTGMGVMAAALAAPSVAKAAATNWEVGYYPDPRVRVLDPSGASLRTGLAGVERLATGFRFTEGPVWFGHWNSLVFSDLPGDKQYVWDDTAQEVRVFRNPSNNTNGAAKDRQGRLLCCEQRNRRVVRIEFDGSVKVIADSFEGKPLNSPNDVICKSDGSIWFTDPPNGITNDYEGRRADQEQANANVFRVDPETGDIKSVISDIRPNGLCFNEDETLFYVLNSNLSPRGISVYDVVNNGTELANGRPFIQPETGTADGIKCDWRGNIWCSWGAGDVDRGVRVFSPAGLALLQIDLPERAANLTFGGPVGNRLFITAQQSLYSVYVGTRGATLI